jgi:cell division protein FtsI/penicillin-binding protein 2
MTMIKEDYPVDCLHSTGRRQFLHSLLALFLLARGKASVAKVEGRDLFYLLDLRKGKVEAPADYLVASGAPGSLLKLVLAAAFCENRLPAYHQTIVCNGTIVVDGARYSCRAPHGKLCLPLALGQSCNVFFASVIKQLNPSQFAGCLEKLGLPVPARITLDHQEFHGPDFIDFSLGLTKEISVDALDVLNLVALVASRGTVRNFILKDPKKALLRVCKNPDFSPSTWTVLQEGMQLAGRAGTARNLDIHNKLHLAVKTGTTQVGGEFKSWVAGYFPYEAPKFAFCVRAETGTSYDAAVPIARRLLFARTWL